MPTDYAFDVFLSYARADDHPNYDDPALSFMRRLYNALTSDGLRVWWDRETLPARSLDFSPEIETGIYNSERFILVAGMRWSRQGSERIITIRSAILSNQFSSLWSRAA
ncbi:MAG: toll/interleukin-1 receptor domain-containing protein [Armatimonadetes bacterium]|nr:toll/interleukin-1 receptor domain-containing protein [Anaerolineae bacterium]